MTLDPRAVILRAGGNTMVNESMCLWAWDKAVEVNRMFERAAADYRVSEETVDRLSNAVERAERVWTGAMWGLYGVDVVGPSSVGYK